jgi:hypothetical protein
VTEAEINPGGKHHDEITRRVAALGAAPAGGSARDEKAAAEVSFGPDGELAAGFMKRSAWRI